MIGLRETTPSVNTVTVTLPFSGERVREITASANRVTLPVILGMLSNMSVLHTQTPGGVPTASCIMIETACNHDVIMASVRVTYLGITRNKIASQKLKRNSQFEVCTYILKHCRL